VPYGTTGVLCSLHNFKTLDNSSFEFGNTTACGLTGSYASSPFEKLTRTEMK
jgi:hypothetical protein